MTIQCFLYDADGSDRSVRLDNDTLTGLDDRKLLWIDLEGSEPDELDRVADLLSLDLAVLQPPDRASSPRLTNHGAYFHFHVETAPRPKEADPDSGTKRPSKSGVVLETIYGSGVASSARLDFFVGKLWLLTIHDAPVPLLLHFREQDKADTAIGELSPQALVASLLDWHIGEYFNEVSTIQAAVDRLDERVLREHSNKILLGRIVAMRRRVAKLRMLLVSQRDVLYGLSRPDFALVTESGAEPYFAALATRFERALDEVERTRDVVTGSFDLFTSRTGQQTNDLVKVLTFVTAVLGFCAAIAGIFGMNFEVSLFRSGYTGFYLVTLSMMSFALFALAVAVLRKWI